VERSRTVLLVEDEPAVQDVAVEMLRENNFSVLIADDGPHALRLLATDPSIDLLLTDVVMPDLNGFQLAHRARALRPSLPIIYISGYADEARLAAEAVHGPVLRKPFRTADLVHYVTSMLEHSRRSTG
jgi:CheY-like chemotaxis protein